MRIIRLIVLVLITVFISACVTARVSRQSPYVSVVTDPCDWGGNQITVGDLTFASLMRLPEAVYCSVSGKWTDNHQPDSGAMPQESSQSPLSADGYYSAPNGTFSVAAPYDVASDAYAHMRLSEQNSLGGDDVSFSSAAKPAVSYAVMTFTRHSTQMHLSSSLEDFADSFVSQQRTQSRRLGLAISGQMYAESINLAGATALFRVYRAEFSATAGAQVSAKRFGQQLYYLMYFFKTLTGKGVIWIAWSGECGICKTGPESAIRSISPDVTRFVGSFELSG